VRVICGKLRRPYVLMPHGMLDPYSLSVKPIRKQLYLWAFERKNIKSAQRVIFTTDEEASLATKSVHGMPPTTIVPLGADAPKERNEELKAIFENEFPSSRGKRCLLFLGRIHEKKGLDRIISAFPGVLQRFPDSLLVVAGDGEKDYLKQIVNSI